MTDLDKEFKKINIKLDISLGSIYEVCPSCNELMKYERLNYHYDNFELILKCPKCGFFVQKLIK